MNFVDTMNSHTCMKVLTQLTRALTHMCSLTTEYADHFYDITAMKIFELVSFDRLDETTWS